MREVLKRLVWEEDGQTLTEYGILLALIAVGVIAVLVVMGPKIKAAFQEVNDNLP
ncbi:MAG: Flp family type IVb pilin [Bacillota bacterium]|nr:Flp family type IVb pilin [Bacillota bacterium]